jgi:hypothetical protein
LMLRQVALLPVLTIGACCCNNGGWNVWYPYSIILNNC